MATTASHMFFVDAQYPRKFYSYDGENDPVELMEVLTNFTDAKAIGDTIYIALSTTDAGKELYKSDGTVEGTSLVKDINPGSGNGVSRLAVANEKVFMNAHSGDNDYELWISDGTEGGTKLLKDINPSDSSNPINFITVGDTIYFVAKDGDAYSYRIWQSDGTVEGTTKLPNIDSAVSKFAHFDGKLYFTFNDTTHGKELWEYDLETQTKQMVSDYSYEKYTPPESAAFFPELGSYAITDNKLIFRANPHETIDGADNVQDDEPWVYDGANPPFKIDVVEGTYEQDMGFFGTETVAKSSDPSNFISMSFNDAPVIAQGDEANVTMSEDSTPNAFALTLDATDAENDAITWSISSDGSNGTASVSDTPTGTSQAISYTPDENFNGTDSFVVQAKGGGASSITVNVTVEPVDDTATDITLSNSSVNQDASANTVVGTLSNDDPDTGEIYTYTLVTGTGDSDNAMFNISGTDLNVTDANPSVGSYSVRVNVNDGTTDFAKTLSITVEDNIAPEITTPTQLNMVNGSTTVTTVAGTDSQSISWSIDGGGQDDNLFDIDPSTGALTLNNPADMDSQSSYIVKVAAYDGVNTTTKTITVRVLDPVILNYQGFLAKDGAGVNEALSITFKLYDAATNGNEVWRSSTKDVNVTNGIYNVALGESVLMNDLDILDTDYYLGVTVESNDEMTPRQLIAPSGYTKLLNDKHNAQ